MSNALNIPKLDLNIPGPELYKSWSKTPSGILNFMQNNVIYTGKLENSRMYNVPEYLYLSKTKRVVEKDGNITGYVYNLVNGEAGEKFGVKSFICDYKVNSFQCAVLTSKANFCFTVTMNGCTFGIGSPTPSGEILVSHCNIQKDTGTQSGNQRDKTLKVYRALNQNVDGMLETSMYRQGGRDYATNTATTFGLRDPLTNKWTFYFQAFKNGFDKVVYHGVFPVKTNSMTG
jgi:hypothetical protein